MRPNFHIASANTTIHNLNKIMQSCHPNPIKRIVFSKCSKEENIDSKIELFNEPILTYDNIKNKGIQLDFRYIEYET